MIKISEFNIKEGNFAIGELKYRVVDLIETSKNLPIIEIPLEGLDIGVCPWGEKISIKDFVFHMKRIDNSSLEFPVILDNTGYICDGWHRVAKAIYEGEDTIKARRLTVMPDPIG